MHLHLRRLTVGLGTLVVLLCVALTAPAAGDEPAPGLESTVIAANTTHSGAYGAYSYTINLKPRSVPTLYTELVPWALASLPGSDCVATVRIDAAYVKPASALETQEQGSMWIEPDCPGRDLSLTGVVAITDGGVQGVSEPHEETASTEVGEDGVAHGAAKQWVPLFAPRQDIHGTGSRLTWYYEARMTEGAESTTGCYVATTTQGVDSIVFEEISCAGYTTPIVTPPHITRT